jgi:poly(3-hydroxybutyrate) depolymerase
MTLWELPRAVSSGAPVSTATRCGSSPVRGSSRCRAASSQRPIVAPNRAGRSRSCRAREAIATVESTGHAWPG